jgi:hypothetical protein
MAVAVDNVPSLLKWMPAAVILALIVYLVQITYRLAEDETRLGAIAVTVQERTPAFTNLIKIESRLAVIDSELERRKPIVDSFLVHVEEQNGAHRAIDVRIGRLEAIVDRLEIRLESLINMGRSSKGPPPDFSTLRPHGSTPDGEAP